MWHSKTVPVITALAHIPEVRGIVCFGSYAVGTFDANSDVDLFVLCQPKIPSSQARLGALQGIQGVQELDIGHVEFGWDNQWCPQGDPATKRTEDALQDLEIAPDRFLERYKKLLETPLASEGRKVIVEEFESLLTEVAHLAGEKALRL